MKPTAIAALALPLVIAACIQTDQILTPDSGRYTPPEAWGLVSLRPFPNPNDVCRVMAENALTSEFLDDSATLIGCPVHERGAISNRQAAGGRRVGAVGDWILISMPD